MVNTKSQTKMAENADLFALLSEMKKSVEKGQEEMKKEQEETKKELEKGREEMKNLIPAGKEVMRAHVETNQLVASLRGSVAEVLPAEKLTDLITIRNALESRFGDSHLTQFYRKITRQKPVECVQALAADMKRLMSLT
ncbi:hypothetical protein AVEN_94708-1 [Araneus ventricosus]|uniref:Uncharacterized protein n=1 Tax=Araneus ventricosus TaxID=182803 RepID=A0A4Y2CMK3_ARAVE|nr:hypothetical protein AVEN_94708-1 [Araneus ventricosus]